MQFPSRALTDKFISQSYQDVLQQYSSSSLYYILDGLGNVVAIFNSASAGDLLITSNMTASMSVASASFATSASYEIIHETSSSYAETSSVAITSIFSDTASIAISAYMADTASLAAEAISASYAPSVPSDIAISASWASSSLSASYVPDLYPQTEQVSCSWASSSLSASYVPNLYPQTYQESASWASSSISASYVPDLYPQTEQVSASWASQSLSASYVPDLYPQTYQESASWASASLSASYVPDLYPQTEQMSASWASSSISASYVPDLYPQTEQVSCSWASASLSASYVPDLYPQTYQESASWASSSLSASYVPDLYPQTEQISASWASSSLSSSYASTASLLLGSVESASYAGTSSVLLGSVESASYALSASYVISSTGNARPVLTSNREYYVHPTGSSSNDGLSWLTAFRTIQDGLDAASLLDASGYYITINLANGTYSGSSAPNTTTTIKPVVGLTDANFLRIVGNLTSSADVHVSASTVCFRAGTKAAATLSGMKISSGGSIGIQAFEGGIVYTGVGVHFGVCTYHMLTSGGGYIRTLSNYVVSGSADRHIWCQNGGVWHSYQITVTHVGTPAYGTAFAFADVLSLIMSFGSTYTGAATGRKYYIQSNAVCQTYGSTGSYFPGNLLGLTIAGGLYI